MFLSHPVTPLSLAEHARRGQSFQEGEQVGMEYRLPGSRERVGRARGPRREMLRAPGS